MAGTESGSCLCLVEPRNHLQVYPHDRGLALRCHRLSHHLRSHPLLCVPVPDQLPAVAPGTAANDGPGAGCFAHVGDLEQAPSFSPARPGCCGPVGSDPAVRRSLSLSLLLCFSNKTNIFLEDVSDRTLSNQLVLGFQLVDFVPSGRGGLWGPTIPGGL